MSVVVKEGVITLIGPVEPFVTVIKMKSIKGCMSINMSIYAKSSNKGMFQRDDQVAYI